VCVYCCFMPAVGMIVISLSVVMATSNGFAIFYSLSFSVLFNFQIGELVAGVTVGSGLCE